MQSNVNLKTIQLHHKSGSYLISSPSQKIILYLCGPTVYDDVHIGNLRGVIIFDLLIRLLKLHKYDFVYYQNITDIDDKIVQRAQERNQSETTISVHYSEKYYQILKQCKVLSPTFLSVTHSISIITDFISQLINKKAAYVKKSGVYFDTQKAKYFHPATNLKKSIDNSTFEADKKHIADFALWKNNLSGQKWNSPWGNGRPGWHTECVALINHFAGNNLNIHGGGIDLSFPHHFNEEVQFRALNPNFSLTDFWLNHGFINWNLNKLSKSNVTFDPLFLAKNFLKKYSTNVLRLVLYSSFYSQDIQMQNTLLLNAQQLEQKIKNILIKTRLELFLNNNLLDFDLWEDFDPIWWEKFILILNNNLNTVKAIDLLHELLKTINILLLEKNYKKTFCLTKTLLKLLNVLGIEINLLKIDQTVIKEIEMWKFYLKSKKYLAADALRKVLQKKEILI